MTLEEAMNHDHTFACNYCGKKFETKVKQPVVYDHGKRYCPECYTEVCKRRMEGETSQWCKYITCAPDCEFCKKR